jgi:hypothetical protein
MREYQQFIGGGWCAASSRRTKAVINPASEDVVAVGGL